MTREDSLGRGRPSGWIRWHTKSPLQACQYQKSTDYEENRHTSEDSKVEVGTEAVNNEVEDESQRAINRQYDLV